MKFVQESSTRDVGTGKVELLIQSSFEFIPDTGYLIILISVRWQKLIQKQSN